MSADPFIEVREMCGRMRGILEQMLQDAMGTGETEGSCLHAAILLSSLISRFSGGRAHVAGGGPPMDGGMRDKTGVLRGHYWVEGALAGGQEFVADITADQFGYEKVILLPLAEARKLYLPGNPETIAQHVAEELVACTELVGPADMG